MNTEQASLESALTSLFQSRAGNRNPSERDSPLQHRQTHDKQGLESLAPLILPRVLQVGKDAHTACKQVGETDAGGCKS